MGCITCNNIKNKQKKQLTQILQQQSISTKSYQNLDLPYRHYIHKNIYIPSSLPHLVNHFIPHQKLRIEQNIQYSSIMIRRQGSQMNINLNKYLKEKY